MAEWKIKGAAEDVEQKSAQEQEQAVLDKQLKKVRLNLKPQAKRLMKCQKLI